MTSSRRHRATWLATIFGVLAAALFWTMPASAEVGWSGRRVDAPNPGTIRNDIDVVSDGLEGPAIFEYDLLENSSASGEWEFTIPATQSGPITLDWNYEGFHAFFQVRVKLNAIVRDEGGAVVQDINLVDDGPINCCTAPSGGFAYSGEVTLDVEPGDTYGFVMVGSNFDSNGTIMGRLTVDTAIAPPRLDTPTLVQALPTTDGLVVVGQLTGDPESSVDLELLTAPECVDGTLFVPDEVGSMPGFEAVGSTIVEIGGDGQTFVSTTISPDAPLETYVAVRTTSSGFVGEPSDCIVAGPDNDAWTRALQIPLTGGGSAGSGQAIGYLDVVGGARWYKFDIVPGAKASIDLTNLPDDFDLAVFRDIEQEFVELNSPQDVDDLNQLSAEFAPSAFSPSAFSPSAFSPSAFSPSAFSPSAFSPSAFSPSAFSPSAFSPSAFSAESYASAQTRSLIAASARVGAAPESLVVDTWNNTGSFYVRVTGKNGAFSVEQPFQLDISLDGQLCAGVDPITGPAPSFAAGGFTTLILWNRTRMLAQQGNDEASVNALQAKLDELAARPEVNGLVVDLAAQTRVTNAHAQADATPSCVFAQNLAARSIKEVVDAVRATNQDLEYVVLAGTDAEIPFFRYPDQSLLGPEENYDPPMRDGTTSQAALRLNYILGQDEYGASRTVDVGDTVIPLPQLAVGRLVETATEMTTVIDAYLLTDAGVVDDPASTLVTGYDFLTDTADAIQDEFEATTGAATTNDSIITAADISPQDPRSWTADDLRTGLFGKRHDLMFLAGHFSANSALAADYQTQVVTTELAASSVDLTNAIVFSAGCHSGYNIVDGQGVQGVTLGLDWTQAFAQKGATLIAGTGYQYGDTDFIEYSERLYLEFTRRLRAGTGPVPIGVALVDAKQTYLATTPDMRGLHRKSVVISTIFGLPMLKIDLPEGRGTGSQESSIVASTAVAGQGPGQVLGLEIADVTIGTNTDGSATTVELTDVTVAPTEPTITATYFTGEDGVVTNPGEPAIPLFSANVTVAGRALRGIGLRGGSWGESPVVPLTGAPTTEIRGVHTPFSSTINFPMRLASANYFGALQGDGHTRLNVVGAQHRVNAVGDIEAIIRRFAALDLRLYYSDNTQSYAVAGGGENIPALSAPPQISGVEVSVDGDDVVIEASVVGDPAAGIQEVWALTTNGAANAGTWALLDLVQDPDDSTRWTGRLVGAALATQRLDVIIQAANGVGLVTLDDNFGSYYSLDIVAGEPVVEVEPVATALTLIDPPSSGTYRESITVTADLIAEDGSPVSDANVLFTLGTTTRAAVTDGVGRATAVLPINALPGLQTLAVAFAGGDGLEPSGAQAAFTVAKAASSLTLTSTGATRVGDTVDLGITAELLNNAGGALDQRTVYFRIQGDGVDLVVNRITDLLGRATLPPVAVPPGDYTVTANFLGTITGPGGETLFVLVDDVYESSSATTAATVDRFDVGLTLDGPSPVALPGGDIDSGLSATLVDAVGGDPIAGATVTFTVDPGGTAEVYERVTGADGVAELGTIPFRLGTTTIEAALTGDDVFADVTVATEFTLLPTDVLDQQRARLQAVRPELGRLDSLRAALAIRQLQLAASPRLWDGTELADRTFARAVLRIGLVIRRLDDIRSPAVDVEGEIELLVELVDTVVVNAIDDAIARGGNQRYIDFATRTLDSARARVANGRPDRAMTLYRYAWLKADWA